MSNALSDVMIREYRESGYCFPYRVLPEVEAQSYRDAIEDYERTQGEPLAGKYRYKVHLLFTWARDLIRHPKILDAVEQLIGQNILVWTTNVYLKEPHDGRYISWHQDKPIGGWMWMTLLLFGLRYLHQTFAMAACSLWPALILVG